MTRALIAATAVVLFAACARSDNRNADSVAALNAAGTSTPQQRVPGPGELTKPIAQYTGEEFYQLTQSLQYAGASERTRRCRGQGCDGPNPARNTRLRVEGVVGEDAVDVANVPQFGVIVSRGRNLGGLPDRMYGTLPGARYSYFLVILPPAASGDSARWQIEQLDVQGPNRSHSSLTTGLARGCNHPPQRGPGADFRSCADTTIFRPASMTFQAEDEDPWWFICEDGCCTTG